VTGFTLILGNGVLNSVGLHTSAPLEKHRNVRKGLRVPKMTERHIETIKNMHNRKPFWAKPTITASSHLAKTLHPKNQFEAEDKKIQAEIMAKSAPDEPVDVEKLAQLADLVCYETIVSGL
jgi:hypothetical protein